MKKDKKRRIMAYIIIFLIMILCNFIYGILYLKGIIPPKYSYIPECILTVGVCAMCAVKFKDKIVM